MMHRALELRVPARLLAVPATLLIALVIVGYGEPPPSASTQPDADAIAVLTGPTGAVPVRVPTAVANQALVACQNDASFARLPADVRVTGIDARGGGRIRLLLEGTKAFASCGLVMDALGAMHVGDVSTGFGQDLDPLVGPFDLQIWSWSSESSGGQVSEERVIGGVGPGIAAVEIVLADGSAVRATVSGGMFTAWWPAVRGVVIRGYDTTGAKVAEQRTPST
jgi:hypothetical protein